MGANYHTSRITSATAITLPRANLWLAEVRLRATTTAGAFQYRYAGSAQATFACPSNGTIGRRTFKMRQQINGTTIPSGAQTFTGGLTTVELIFTDTAPTAGASFDDMRGIVSSRTDAGAVTANIVLTYDVAPAAPKSVEVFISASEGRIVFPAIDQLTPQVEAVRDALALDQIDRTPAPPFSPSNTLTVSGITDAAATLLVVVYY